MNKKITSCTKCTRTFWYVDPRPGGRPRQKCGICSSRPPRYPWGFLAPNETKAPEGEVYIPDLSEPSSDDIPATDFFPVEEMPIAQAVTRELDTSGAYAVSITRNHPVIASTSTNGAHKNGAHKNGAHKNGAHKNGAHKNDADTAHSPLQLERIEQKLDLMSERLEELEEQVKTLKSQTITRSDWIDLSARLDIVEQDTNTTLGKVRTRLDSFTKDVRQIAVVPEKELAGMFDLVKMLRIHLAPDNSGNQ